MIRIRVICQSYFIDSANKSYKIMEKQVVLNPYLSTGLSECGKAKLEVNKHLVIPATDPNGKQVTGIAPKAFYKKGIESVTFPSGVMITVEENVKDEVADCFTFDENGVLTGLIGRCELVSQLPNIEDVELRIRQFVTDAHSNVRIFCLCVAVFTLLGRRSYVPSNSPYFLLPKGR